MRAHPSVRCAFVRPLGACGLLALAAALALGAPGVQPARAQEPGRAPEARAPLCRAGGASPADARALVARRMALEAKRQAATERAPRVLHGRGLRYGARPDVLRQLQRVRAEARHQSR